MLFSIICGINAKEIIISSENINNIENVINENSKNEENLVLKFKEKYYDMSELPSDLLIASNVTFSVTFSGYSDGTIFDFKNDFNGIINITYSNNIKSIIKFENIIFENFGQDIEPDDHMFSVNFDTDENYLKFENCTFRDIHYTIFEMKISYNKENNNLLFNPDYYITFDNCNF